MQSRNTKSGSANPRINALELTVRLSLSATREATTNMNERYITSAGIDRRRQRTGRSVHQLRAQLNPERAAAVITSTYLPLSPSHTHTHTFALAYYTGTHTYTYDEFRKGAVDRLTMVGTRYLV